MPLQYVKAQRLFLKNHAEFTESWLQNKIIEDPTILGIGDVEVLNHEVRQERAGRLDLLLFDRSVECRFEVELMLGATDESHIIRSIEYWDIERRKYPGYDHCAVLVAEDITSRFLNVMSLFAGTIPMIAIQLNALQVGDQIVLDFVKVLDRVSLRQDDEAEAINSVVDRDYWNNRTSAAIVEMADQLLNVVNRKSHMTYRLNYNKHYIGMHDGVRSRNFISYTPKRTYMYLNVRLSGANEWARKFDAAEIESGVQHGRLWITLQPQVLADHFELLQQVIDAAKEEFQKE